MITLVYPVHPKTGRRLDLGCPVILCDACGSVIDCDHPGLLVWRQTDDRAAWHVHKGRCDRLVEASAGEHLLSRELEDWLSQLTRNYADPLVGSEIELDSGDLVRIHGIRPQSIGETQ